MAGAKLRVSCVGDSITHGYGVDVPSRQGYPAVMQGLLGDGYVVQNFGSDHKTMTFYTNPLAPKVYARVGPRRSSAAAPTARPQVRTDGRVRGVARLGPGRRRPHARHE